VKLHQNEAGKDSLEKYIQIVYSKEAFQECLFLGTVLDDSDHLYQEPVSYRQTKNTPL